jgi:hypothetical protein
MAMRALLLRGRGYRTGWNSPTFELNDRDMSVAVLRYEARGYVRVRLDNGKEVLTHTTGLRGFKHDRRSA